MSRPSVIDRPATRKRRVPKDLRRAQLLALETMGLTRSEIAERFNVSTSSITRDFQEIEPVKTAFTALLTDIQGELAKLQDPSKIAENYVALATKDPNGSVKLGAQDRILELRGVITEKERLRAKSHEPAAPQPMFVLPPGANLSFTFNAAQPAPTTTDGSEASLHNARYVTSGDPTTSDKTEE